LRAALREAAKGMSEPSHTADQPAQSIVETGRMLDALSHEAPAAPSAPQPLQPIRELMRDPSLTEVMINGPRSIYVERGGHLVLTDNHFDDENHLLKAVELLVLAMGRRLSQDDIVLEGRLPDGSRLTVAMPPVAVDGPFVTIRKFSQAPYQLDTLLKFGSLSVEAAAFLRTAVLARGNLLISGGSSTGKTTLLNALVNFVPGGERIVAIEDAAELRLQQEHVCRLESVPAGDRVVTLRDLVKLAIRMRPDRLLVGEVRAAEALDLLQAMNTGHDGAMSTIHANSARDALSRLETLALMAGLELPVNVIRRQILSSIDLVIHLNRLRDGSRRVVSIAEVIGLEGQTFTMQEIFLSETIDPNARGGTRLQSTGIRPRIIDKAYARHITSPEILQLFPPNPSHEKLDVRRGTPSESTGPPDHDRRHSALPDASGAAPSAADPHPH
jgi:pilus assembly protein CpaF